LILAVLASATVVLAQTSQAEQRFTFTPAPAAGAPSTGANRLALVINKWSTDADRDRVLAGLKEGPNQLSEEIREGYTVGYIDWVGGLQYTLRYAYQVPRADGGQDVILGADPPIPMGWSAGSAVTPSRVIQLRLNKDGRGEGKVGTKAAAAQNGKTFVLEDFDTLPAALADVQREGRGSPSSN